VAGGRQEVGL